MSRNKFIVFRAQSTFISSTDNMGPRAPVGAGPLGGVRGAAPMREVLKLDLKEETLSTADVADLRRDPETVAIAPPMPLSLIKPLAVTASDGPPVTAAGNAWGIEAVGAHNSSFDGNGAVVAVLDTGIDPNHPAFAGVNLVRRNFTTESDDDLHGHGTHCAGTIFGRDVSGTRIGVARGVKKAVIGKVLGQGGGSSATLATAINWAVENGANVISMSLGIDFPGFVKFLVDQEGMEVEPATSLALSGYRANVNLFSRITDFLEAQSQFGTGVMVVAASGNESNRPSFVIAVAPPAAGNGMVSVGALLNGSSGFEVARFSNTECNCSAPGVAIQSAKAGGGLTTMSGTSMATPHVAGVAALWAQKELQDTGSITTTSIVAKVLGNATRAGLKAGEEMNDVGVGIVQAP